LALFIETEGSLVEVKPLTKKQAAVLAFMVVKVEQSGGLPTCQELKQAFDLSSLNCARNVFDLLRQKGYLSFDDGTASGYRLNPEVFEVEEPGQVNHTQG
jgi:SOS-response transcriptional repressor LexA